MHAKPALYFRQVLGAEEPMTCPRSLPEASALLLHLSLPFPSAIESNTCKLSEVERKDTLKVLVWVYLGGPV